MKLTDMNWPEVEALQRAVKLDPLKEQFGDVVDVAVHCGRVWR